MRGTWVLSLGCEMPWRRDRIPNPVFWPGEFHEPYSPLGCKELNMTEQLSLSLFLISRVWIDEGIECPGNILHIHGHLAATGQCIEGAPHDPSVWPKHTLMEGEGNGNPLQYTCLENPMDRGAWWATVYGVAQSRTWLKWLSSSSKLLPIFSWLVILTSLQTYHWGALGMHPMAWI